jgi:hypothetical protein
MRRTTIGRRTTLRGLLGGAAISVGLPTLEAMQGRRASAFAQSGGAPKRFGVWYFGGGIGFEESNFFPAQTGATWSLPKLLEPLAKVKDYVTVVSGTSFDHFEAGISHHWQRAATLSNSFKEDLVDLVSKSGYGGPTLPSIDQVVAEAWKGQTKLPSIELAISTAGPWARTSSWKAAKNRMPGITDPSRAFDRLFSDGASGSGVALPPSSLVGWKKSVLDVTQQDAAALLRVVGSADKKRIEAHLESIRELERTIETTPKTSAAGGGCALPPPPSNGGSLAARNKAMADLLVVALVCDVVRVFNFEFTGFQTNDRFSEIGINVEQHPMTHGEVGDRRRDMPKTVLFEMQQLAYLLERLKETPEGQGNLLDSLCLYVATEANEGGAHKTRNLPMLVVGRGAGTLRAGIHHRVTGNTNGGRVMLTLLQAMGLSATKQGYGRGAVSDPISALRA